MMKRIFAVAAAACLLAGCGSSDAGRYSVDTIRIRTEGPHQAEPATETYPLNAWFEIESGTILRIHDGGVTSVYAASSIVKTRTGFEAVADDRDGHGRFAWSFDRGDPDGVSSLTVTYDRIHFLTMISKGKESR
jgi:hypothetical protein